MTRTFQILIAVVAVLVLLFALSANTQASVEPQIVRVTLTDYHVDLSQFTVTPGKAVEFVVENQSAVPHQIVVRPYIDSQTSDVAGALTIGPGTMRTFQQSLAPGIYRVECVSWDHAERGMVNVIAAEAPAQRAFPLRMDIFIPLLTLVLGSLWIIGDSLGLRFVRQ
jgi:plastocyanin